MKKLVKNYKFWFVSGLIIGINFISVYFPKCVDLIYSQHIFKYISTLIRFITHWIPFSLAGLMIIFFVLYLFYSLYQILIKKQKLLLKLMIKPLILVYILFIALWGFNYQRLSISDHLNLKLKSYGIDEVMMVLTDLIDQMNDLREELVEDENGIFMHDMTVKELSMEAKKGYHLMSENFPIFKASYLHIKPVLFSSIMINTGIDGMYFPFSAEAHINTSSPDLYLPFTALHEMAHQIGFAREDEANFIAYYIGIHHPNDVFKYSSILLVTNYLLRIIRNHDLDLYDTYLESLSPKIKVDLEAYKEFWSSLDNPIKTISFKINDLFLKANRQEDGQASYGRVTDWLIAYHLED